MDEIMDEILDYFFLCDRLRSLMYDFITLRKTIYNNDCNIEYVKFLDKFRELFKESHSIRKLLEKHDCVNNDYGNDTN